MKSFQFFFFKRLAFISQQANSDIHLSSSSIKCHPRISHGLDNHIPDQWGFNLAHKALLNSIGDINEYYFAHHAVFIAH